MTRTELRRWLVERLSPRAGADDWKVDILFDAVRDVDRTYLDRALNGDDRDRNDLLAEARRHWKTIVRTSKGSPSGARETTDVWHSSPESDDVGHLERDILGPAATRRMEAFALGLGRMMTREELVRRLRAEFLGRTMTRGEAEAFCRSPAARLCTLEEFQSYGIPVIGHEWQVLEEHLDQDGVPRSWRFIVDPPGFIVTGGAIRGPNSRPTFVSIGRDDRDLFVRPDSALGEILDLAGWLANQYAVDERHAMHLILTDELPPIAPIRPDPPPREIGSKDPLRPWGRFELTLVIDPWLPEEALLRLYRDARRAVLGRKSRSVSSRALEVFRFCITRIEEEPDWRQLLTEWDKAHADAAFGRDGLDAFRATFKRAYRVVMGQSFDQSPRRSRRARGPRTGSVADNSR